MALGVSKSDSDKYYDTYGKLYPVGRYGMGADIGNAVLYLASDDSSFITVLHEPISAIWTQDGEGTYIVPL